MSSGVSCCPLRVSEAWEREKIMAENKEIARQLAGFVAEFMTVQSAQEWKVDPSRNPDAQGAYITEQETGATIYVYLDWRNTDRVVIDSSYPEGSKREIYPEPQAFRTTAARDRDPYTIAAQVLKKVAVPEFFAEHKRCTEKLADREVAFAARDELARRLVNAFTANWVRSNTGDDSPEGSRRELSWWRHGEKPIHVDAKIDYRGEKVDVTVEDLSPDEAARVMELLKSFYN